MSRGRRVHTVPDWHRLRQGLGAMAGRPAAELRHFLMGFSPEARAAVLPDLASDACFSLDRTLVGMLSHHARDGRLVRQAAARLDHPSTAGERTSALVEWAVGIMTSVADRPIVGVADQVLAEVRAARTLTPESTAIEALVRGALGQGRVGSVRDALLSTLLLVPDLPAETLCRIAPLRYMTETHDAALLHQRHAGADVLRGMITVRITPMLMEHVHMRAPSLFQEHAVQDMLALWHETLDHLGVLRAWGLPIDGRMLPSLARTALVLPGPAAVGLIESTPPDLLRAPGCPAVADWLSHEDPEVRSAALRRLVPG